MLSSKTKVNLLDRVDELAAARLELQSVIGRVPITMIIGQHVLHRLVPSPAIMVEQCGCLGTVAERPGWRCMRFLAV